MTYERLNCTLTAGIDAIVGGAGNDTIVGNSTDNATVYFSSLDNIDGGAGTDTLSIVATGAINTTTPTAVKVANVETVSLTSGSTVTANTNAWTGATNLVSSSIAGATLSAAATTAITETDAALVAGAIAINGGSTVTIAAEGMTTGTITVGATVAPAAAVAVSATGDYTDGANNTMGAIAVTGGSTVAVTVKSGLTDAEKTAAKTDTTNFTETLSAVTVTGAAATTAVTVTQDARVAVAAGTAEGVGKIGVTPGAVTINDVNAASTTKAGVIETVTLTNFGATTVNSGALKSATLGGSARGNVDMSTLGALTTPANTSFQLTLNAASGSTTSTVSIDSDITALNITGTGTASTSTNSLVGLSAAGVTALTVDGANKVSFSSSGTNTLTALKTVTVTNTAGFNMGGTAIGNSVTFTGGAGADTVKLGSGPTKAITMGAGNDVVTYGGAVGTGGSVSAGEGTDTIVMTFAQADAADASATFNTKWTGFEVLDLSDALTGQIDLAGLNGVTTVALDAAASSGTLNGLASGGTVELYAGANTLTVAVANALYGASDVLNLNDYSGVTALGTVTASNVETVNIALPDDDLTDGVSAARVETLTLVDIAAKTVTVSGNNGLNLTVTGNINITNFDASGVVANANTLAADADTAANLGVTFASVTAATSTILTTSITGGAGNDTLTGNSAKDTIVGGAGNDAIDGAAGADTLTGGAGSDTFNFATGESTYSAYDTITDLSAKDTIQINGGGTINFVQTAVTGTATAAAISKYGVATFATVVGADTVTIADKVKVINAAVSTAGDAVLFQQDGETFLFVETNGNTTADTAGIVVKLTGVALPADQGVVTGSTGLIGFGG